MKVDPALIRARLDLPNFLHSRYGLTFQHGKARCLFADRHKNGDRNPSWVLSRDGRSVKCMAGDHFQGFQDCFGILMVFEGLSFPHAVQACLNFIRGISPHTNEPSKRRIAATYGYVDEGGQLLFQVVRFDPKGFAFRRPDGQGNWVWNLDNARLVLFHLPEILSATHILICEGEKDVESAHRLGLPPGWAATTNPMGAEKWRKDFSECLRGKHVVISPHTDDIGQRHGEQVRQSLQGMAHDIRRLTLPSGKDFSEWEEAGGTQEQFHEYLRSANPWNPASPGAGVDPPRSEKDGQGLLPSAEESGLQDFPQEEPEKDGVVMLAGDAIEPVNVQWAWQGRIPVGSVTVIAGDPGWGKTTIAIELTARWTQGQAEGDLYTHPVPVVIASAEDSFAHTLVPRLIASGAKRQNFHFIQYRQDGFKRGISLPGDLPAISQTLHTFGAKILIIDPLVAHLDGKVNSWRDQDIRKAVAPLARMADEQGIAVLAVVHLNKCEAKQVLSRVGGSIGIVAAARSVLLVGPNPGNEQECMLAHAKCNVGPLAPTKRYRVEPRTISHGGKDIITSGIVWLGDSQVSASEILTPPDREGRAERDEAKEMLTSILKDGPRKAEEILGECRKLGLSEKTLRRAKTDLGVQGHRIGFGKEGYWEWSLSKDGHKDPIDGQSQKSGHLCETPQKKSQFSNTLPIDGQQPDIDHLCREDGAEQPTLWEEAQLGEEVVTDAP